MATLISSDAIEVQATLQAIKQSITIGTMLELLGEEKIKTESIPIHNADGETLKKVVEWCEHHRDDEVVRDDAFHSPAAKKAKKTEVPQWDKEFLEKLNSGLLCRVTVAADYLEIPKLQSFGVAMIAQRLRGLTTEQMGELLGIECDYTPEEIAEIREMHGWIFEKEDA